MSIRTKFKLGDRVIFTDVAGIENLGVITGIAITYDGKGTSVVYRYNLNEFSEAQIVGRVLIQKPRRTRGQKKVDELKKMNRKDTSMADFLATESAA